MQFAVLRERKQIAALQPAGPDVGIVPGDDLSARSDPLRRQLALILILVLIFVPVPILVFVLVPVLARIDGLNARVDGVRTGVESCGIEELADEGTVAAYRGA